MSGTTVQETILVVDDESSYRMMLRSLLRLNGYAVIEAENGDRGVTVARKEHPDLIILDVNMPILQGPEAIKILKDDPTTADIPIIVVSAREDSNDLLRCFQYGASDYVRKIFRHEELIARIRTHLDVARLRRELVAANQQLQRMNRSLRDSLVYAGEIQRAILGRVLPEVDGVDFIARYRPCDETSGDYYSAFWLDHDHVGICVADAAGHGIGAAMLAVFLKGQLENICRMDGTLHGPIRPPVEVVTLINESLCEKRLGREFISLIYGILHLPTMDFTFVNAGHPYPILLSHDGAAQEIETQNTLAGLFEGISFAEKTVHLAPGQTIFLYSDGITEARSGPHACYGHNRLIHVLCRNAALPTGSLADRVLEDLDVFQGTFPVEDDITILAIANRNPANPG